MTILIVADEERTKPEDAQHISDWEDKIIEVAGKNDDRGEENNSDVTSESYWNSNRNAEKKQPQCLIIIALKTSRWSYSGKFTACALKTSPED